MNQILLKKKKYVLDAIDSTFISSVGAYVDKFELMMANLNVELALDQLDSFIQNKRDLVKQYNTFLFQMGLILEQNYPVLSLIIG